MIIDGIQLLNSEQDMVAKSIAAGSWEDNSRKIWRDYVRDLPPGACVWDVGAYTGYYAMVAAVCRPDIQVIAFEPHPHIFKQLELNVSHNKLENVECINVALGSESKVVELNITNDIELPSGSSLVDIGRKIQKTFSVPCLTADNIVGTDDNTFGMVRNAYPSLIKIDVEEYELEVLRGMMKTLHHSRAKILMEVLSEDKLAYICQLLANIGYSVQRISENDASAPFSSTDRNYICTYTQSL